MIKKRLITCSVMLVMVVISGLFIFSKNDTRMVSKSAVKCKFIYAKNDVSNVFRFADEAIPLNNARIDRKLRNSLANNSYGNIQSNILQIKAARLFPIIEPILKA